MHMMLKGIARAISVVVGVCAPARNELWLRGRKGKNFPLMMIEWIGGSDKLRPRGGHERFPRGTGRGVHPPRLRVPVPPWRAASLLFLPLLMLSFPSLAPQAVATEVQTNCPNRPTGDKRATGNQWDYELHNIYGVGCLDVMVSEVKKVSAAKASEGSSKLYAFRVTSKIAPGPLGRPHSQYFEYKVKLSGTAKQGEDYKFFKRISTHLPDRSNFLFDSSKQWALHGTPRSSVIAVFMFQILDDDEVEPDETVTFTISYLKPRGGGSAEYQIGTASATFTIQNDDVAPTPQRPRISIAPKTSSITEGASATFTLTATPAPEAPVQVGVTVAVDGDYGISAGKRTVTIPTTGSYELTLATTGDGTDEADGSVTATLNAGDSYTIGKKTSSGQVAIADDDLPPPEVTIAAGTSPVTEGGDATFTITADPAPAADLSVSVTVATDGDYGVTAGTRTVTIPTTGSAVLTLTTSDDTTDEPDGSVSVTVTDGAGYTVGSSASGTVSIQDDDVPPEPEVTIAAGTSPVTEGGDASFTLTADPAPAADLSVSVTVATDGDYGITVGERTVTIPTTGSTALTLATTGDATDEPDGSVSVTVTDGAGYTVGSSASGTVSIQDDDAPPEPEVTIAAGTSPVTEGGDASFTLTADPAPAADLSVSVTVATDGDYGVTAGTRTVTIPTTGSATLTVATAGDDTDEPDGSVSVTVKAGAGYTVASGQASATVEVRDNDDAPPRPVSSCVSDELMATAERLYERNRNRPPEYAENWFSVLLAFGARSPEQWTADGRSISPMTSASARQRGWRRFATALECLEGAAPVVPVVSIAGGSAVTEGAGAGFTVSRTGDTSAPLTVLLAVSEDGTGGRDFVAPGEEGDKQVVIQVGSTQATYTVPTGDDAADEPDGTVTLALRADNAYTSGSPSSATVTVRDDDGAPLPEVTVSAGSTVTEGGNAVFTLTASPAPASPLAVSVTMSAAGEYGVTAGKRTVSIPTTGSATLTLATADDNADEPDGSVTATVEDGEGYTVGTSASATVAVRDDDLEPQLEVSIAAKTASITEGTDAAFTVTASRAPGSDLTVKLTVSESGGGDFVAAGNEGAASVTIPKGGTEAAFTVATVNDAADEPDGSVTATLAAGGGYTVAAAPGDAASVAVSDDDAAPTVPTLSVADATAHENEGLMWFTVRLSAKSEQWITVHYRTRESTPVSAQQNRDYLDSGWFKNHHSKVTFPPGRTKQRFYVWLFNDNHNEAPETFEVVLHSPSGEVGIADGVAVGTIVNSDPMPAAWLSRFGRTVAQQALDGIAGRLAAARTPGASGTLAGQAFAFAPGSPAGTGASGGTGAPNASGRGVRAGSTASGLPGSGLLAQAGLARAFGTMNAPGLLSGFGIGAPGSGLDQTVGDRTPGFGNAGFANDRGYAQPLTVQDVLLGSSFTVTGKPDGTGGSLAFWGRAAQARFDGREGRFGLDGEATTALLGADYARGRWLVGLALTQSTGPGGYADRDPGADACPPDMDEQTRALVCDGAVRAGAGTVDASLTAAVPYVAFQATERLRLWGAGGYGTGEVTLTPTLGGVLKADLDWTMAATGMQGDLLPPPAQGTGPALAVISDALWARTASEQTAELAASDSAVTRLRLGLRGSWRLALDEDAGPGTGASLTPKLEVGARHDGGDAETGFGVELGGGVVWVDPALGLSLDLTGRTLLTHEDQDFADQGVAAAFSFDPAPATPRGPSLTLRQDWGGRAQGGLEALFAPDPLTTRPGGAQPSRWALEAAYGVPVFGGRFTGSPQVGLGFAGTARTYTVGWRLTPEAASASTTSTLSFGFQAGRRESAMAQPEHTVGLEILTQW